jgi:hypothetical protein
MRTVGISRNFEEFRVDAADGERQSDGVYVRVFKEQLCETWSKAEVPAQ